MCMRMQPCDAAVPIELLDGVPWMPTAGADVPIQRVPSGLPEPGGIGSRPFAQGEFGGIQVGFFSFSVTTNVPVGDGNRGWPIATGNVPTSLPSRYALSWNFDLSMISLPCVAASNAGR